MEWAKEGSSVGEENEEEAPEDSGVGCDALGV